jgi:hypothetical protein
MIRGLVTLVLVAWLAIGALAAYQRGYFEGSTQSCAKVGTVAATVLVGPLNYTGQNPKVKCVLPKPSS